MSTLAANSAASPSLSLKARETANPWQTAPESGENCLSFLGGLESLEWICDCLGLLQPKHRRELWSRVRLPLCIPPFAWSLLRGHSGARRHCVVLLRLRRPSGHGSSLKGTLPRKHDLALGSRAHSLASPGVTQAGSGNSTNGDTIMYQNKVTLIGFLGSDAEVRSNDNRSFTTLSLATKSSYKKDGKYISHTEWHRCVVFGKLAEFAGTLKKGAHIQVEGELRSREVRQQEDGLKAAHLGDPGRLDSEAGPGREVRPGRAGAGRCFHRGSGRIRPFLFTLGSPASAGLPSL